MTLPPEEREKVVIFRRMAAASGLGVLGLGVVVLVGWAMGLEPLKRVGPGLASMKANTAVGLSFLGVVLAIYASRAGDRHGPLTTVLVAVPLLIGVLTLFQYAAGANLGIDQLFFPEDPGAPETSHPGRMAPSTASGFVLLGVSLLLIDRRSSGAHRFAELLAALTFLVALQALAEYIFGVEVLYGLASHTAMALHTCFALLALSTGTLLLRTDRGYLRVLSDPGPAGIAVRRLIPAALVLPFLFGALAVVAVESGAFSERSALTLVISLVIVFGLGAIGWASRGIQEIDRQRRALVRAEREARAAAEEANRAKSEFLGVMSHELRTPLNSVISYADLLDEEIEGPLNSGQRGYVDRIRVSAHHLRRMIEELLQFTRVSRGRLEADWKTTDAGDLAKEALAVVRREREADGPTLRLDTPSGPIPVKTDEAKVLHILVNLLDNALQFTEDGDVELAVETSDDRIVFEVRDTGPGIPVEDRERIFDPFTQLRDRPTGHGGTGLGLAICRRFADVVGASLDVESVVGEGSTFRLTLPRGRSS